MCYAENNLIEADGHLNLTVDSLTVINHKITALDIITLRKANVKLYGVDKLDISKDIIENKLYKIIDQLNERKVIPIKFYSTLSNIIYWIYDRDGKISKILFVNDNEKSNLLMRQKIKTNNIKWTFTALNAKSLQTTAKIK